MTILAILFMEIFCFAISEFLIPDDLRPGDG
jgi:hypothetical protein